MRGVVVVRRAQRGVQRGGEAPPGRRRPRPPRTSGGGRASPHEFRPDRVFRHARCRPPRRPQQRRLDLLAGQVLAEGREHPGRPPRDQQPRRRAVDEAHGVAQHVAEQPGAGWSAPRRSPRRSRSSPPSGASGSARPARPTGTNSKKQPRSSIEPHALALAAVGDGDEALAGRIDLARRAARRQEGREAVAIGRPGDAAMDQQFERRAAAACRAAPPAVPAAPAARTACRSARGSSSRRRCAPPARRACASQSGISAIALRRPGPARAGARGTSCRGDARQVALPHAGRDLLQRGRAAEHEGQPAEGPRARMAPPGARPARPAPRRGSRAPSAPR